MGRWKIDTATGDWSRSSTNLIGAKSCLQVLISIQSMILCDEPYLNEPAWSKSAGTPQSKQCQSVLSVELLA